MFHYYEWHYGKNFISVMNIEEGYFDLVQVKPDGNIATPNYDLAKGIHLSVCAKHIVDLHEILLVHMGFTWAAYFHVEKTNALAEFGIKDSNTLHRKKSAIHKLIGILGQMDLAMLSAHPDPAIGRFNWTQESTGIKHDGLLGAMQKLRRALAEIDVRIKEADALKAASEEEDSDEVS